MILLSKYNKDLDMGNNHKHWGQDKMAIIFQTTFSIFVNENASISIINFIEFVPGGPISNIRALVRIMAWRRTGDKPLSEAMIS